MNSTRRRTGLAAWMLGCLLAPFAAPSVPAAESPIPHPAALERDVQFWIRVYTKINTDAGYLHDENDLSVVYETLHFEPNTSQRERERAVDAARDHYVAALKRIAFASGPLSDEDLKIRALWGDEATPIRLLEATNHIRFQLGQADRFREGLVRAGQWETHIAETLANLGLPPELAVLPHVESSFNPAAYSKVGAAGLWQFMRSTGRRYMRIDSTVDDRLDPFRATEAAAQLLSYNYRLLGTWPLALTAYNHGAAGMRRAKDALGTDDIVQIVRNYRSPSFGFASRNFYVSFLAALEVDHNPERYFGRIEHTPEARFQELVIPTRLSVAALERATGVDRGELRALNPALLPACWRGQRPVPSGYHLRLPLSGIAWTPQLLAKRLGSGVLVASQPEPPKHRMLPGETLASIAEQYGMSTRALAALNGLRPGARVRIGREIRVPEGGPRLVAAIARTDSAPAAVAPATVPPAPTEPAPSAPASLAQAAPEAAATPVAPAIAPAPLLADAQVSPAAAEPAPAADVTSSPPILVAAPAATPTETAATAQSATPAAPSEEASGEATPSAPPASPPAPVTPPSAPAPSLYVVQRGESLSEIAARVGTTESKLLEINKIRNPDYIFEGQRLRLAASATQAQPESPTANAADSAAKDAAAGAASSSGGVTPAVAERESEEDAAAAAASAKPEAEAEPVSAAQAEALGPALGPAADEAPQSADPFDYAVAKDGTIVVAATETLGHYADWLRLSASRLRNLNHMRPGRPVLMGHRVRLDFARVSREDFEDKRREYHRALEAGYFAAHRITGTEVYIARRGDSLWTVTQRYEHLPVWLLQQYNPDVDFSEMRAGTQIVVPKVEDVVAAGG